MAKRRAVKRPKLKQDWTLLHADKSCEDGWRDLGATQQGPCRTLYERLERDPTAVDNPDRQHQLKGTLSTVMVGGRELPQWQYELAGGARVWYAVHDANQTVYITKASPHHPNETK